jgi:transcriptional regulator GlxA family with amidase domain
MFKPPTSLKSSQERTRQRLENARQLLVGSKRRVSHIALDSGFNSIPYFNRAFRQAFGYPPSKYRAALVGGGNGA